MNRFPLPLRTEDVDAKHVKVIAPFEYHTNGNCVIRIKVGFISDGASIPFFAWPLIGTPFRGRYKKAAFIHDFLYFQGYPPRKYCDEIFLEAMVNHIPPVGWWRRRIMYRMVRMFAWIGWNKHRRRNSEDNLKEGGDE